MQSLIKRAALAALLGASGAVLAAPLALGSSTVSGLLNGTAEGLFSAAAGYGPGVNTTPVSDDEVEFISADGALILDFLGSGELRLYVNSDDGLLSGEREFDFSFAGLQAALGSLQWTDRSALLAGDSSFSLLGPDRFRLSTSDLQFDAPFSYLSLQLNRVPAPAPLALLAAAGLAAVLSARSRRRQP